MLPLSHLLLLEDSRFPWFLLVPARDAITDISHLEEADQLQLFRESMALNRAMHQAFEPDRMNIACIGNLVPQLHVHHIARYETDACWPAPVWGHCQNQGSTVPYTEKGREHMTARLKAVLSDEDELDIDWLIR